MTSNYNIFDQTLRQHIDLDDYFIQEAFLIDRFVGSTLWTWGRGASGQLGNGSVTSLSSPAQVGSLTNWKIISTSKINLSHTAGVRTDGTVWNWGRNTEGQLGQNNVTARSSPVQVGTATDWTLVDAGRYHTVAVNSSGQMWAWGDNRNGQLGVGNATNRSSPSRVGATTTDWKDVACGGFFTVAIKETGTLWAWGRNDVGQLGVNDTTPRSSPAQVGSLTTWKTITANDTHCGSIRYDGSLWMWGRGLNGELGDGNASTRSSPVRVGGTTTNWKLVSAGQYWTAGIRTDNTLWTWGTGGSGVLADGTVVAKSSPIQVGLLRNWKQVSAGRTAGAAINMNGELWTWGAGTDGQLGDGTIVAKSSPIKIGSLTYWKQVSVGGEYSAAVTYTETE